MRGLRIGEAANPGPPPELRFAAADGEPVTLRLPRVAGRNGLPDRVRWQKTVPPRLAGAPRADAEAAFSAWWLVHGWRYPAALADELQVQAAAAGLLAAEEADAPLTGGVAEAPDVHMVAEASGWRAALPLLDAFDVGSLLAAPRHVFRVVPHSLRAAVRDVIADVLEEAVAAQAPPVDECGRRRWEKLWLILPRMLLGRRAASGDRATPTGEIAANLQLFGVGAWEELLR